MRSKARGFAISAVYLILFVLLPNLALRYVSPDLLEIISATLALKLRDLILTLSLIGLIFFGLKLARTLREKDPYVFLISGIMFPALWYYLSIYGLSAGRPSNFGRIYASTPSGEPKVNLLIDLRVILLLLGIATIIEIASNFMEFLSIREGMR